MPNSYTKDVILKSAFKTILEGMKTAKQYSWRDHQKLALNDKQS
jgi:hypothetical protein